MPIRVRAVKVRMSRSNGKLPRPVSHGQSSLFTHCTARCTKRRVLHCHRATHKCSFRSARARPRGIVPLRTPWVWMCSPNPFLHACDQRITLHTTSVHRPGANLHQKHFIWRTQQVTMRKQSAMWKDQAPRDRGVGLHHARTKCSNDLCLERPRGQHAKASSTGLQETLGHQSPRAHSRTSKKRAAPTKLKWTSGAQWCHDRPTFLRACIMQGRLPQQVCRSVPL